MCASAACYMIILYSLENCTIVHGIHGQMSEMAALDRAAEYSSRTSMASHTMNAELLVDARGEVNKHLLSEMAAFSTSL